MSPRQRLSQQPSMEEISSRKSAVVVSSQERALLSDESSAGSSDDSGSNTSSSNNIDRRKAAAIVQTQQGAADVAREQHDYFNLVALLFVVATTLSNWDFSQFLQGHGPAQAWTGAYFYENWATTVLYFLADLIWVSTVPICVKSPDVIIKHHCVAILYLSGPVFFPEFRWFMGACLSVEVNTWLLILRRVVYKARDSSYLLKEAVSLSFYLSWIVIRVFIYPAILVVFLQMAYTEVIATDQLWHWPMIFIPIHFFLCLLNLKWTYDLFQPIVNRWISKDLDASTVTNGL